MNDSIVASQIYDVIQFDAGRFVYGVNCGGDAFTTFYGAAYEADNYYTGGDVGQGWSDIAGTDDDNNGTTDDYAETCWPGSDDGDDDVLPQPLYLMDASAITSSFMCVAMNPRSDYDLFTFVSVRDAQYIRVEQQDEHYRDKEVHHEKIEEKLLREHTLHVDDEPRGACEHREGKEQPSEEAGCEPVEQGHRR